MNMQYSAAGRQLTESFEGLSLIAYADPGTGGAPYTLGYGRAHGINPGDVCTQTQAEQWLMEDIQTAVSTVNNLVTVPLTQSQFDSLVDFSFNAGCGNFAASTLLKKINAGDMTGAQAEFGKWIYSGGRVMNGLVRRRAAEAALFGQEDEGI